MSHILTVDLGTTSVKCGIFTEGLKPLGFSSGEYKLITPDEKRVEADPHIYIEKIKECISGLQGLGADISKVGWIIVTSQGETTIPVSDDNKEMSNAIVWLDRRADKEADELKKRLPADVYYQTTGLPVIDAYTPLAKYKNILKEFKGKVGKFLLLEDYINYYLTGRATSEKTILSSTGFFDIIKDELWDRALDAAGIDKNMIGEVLACGDIIGTIRKESAQYLGLRGDVKVVAGAMDQICGAVGCGNLTEGAVHETTGTAMVIGASVKNPDMKKTFGITLYRHAVEGLYLLIPICRSAAIIQKWFKDEFCRDEESYAKRFGLSVYDVMAKKAEEAGLKPYGPLLFPYFTGSDDIENVRGAFFRIGLDTRREDIIRAIPEGICFMLKDNMQRLEKINISPRKIYSLGGVSKSAFWCQMKADILKKDILASSELESTSFGAACICAVAAGYKRDLIEAQSAYTGFKVYSPRAGFEGIYDEKYKSYKKMCDLCLKFY